MYTVYKLNTCYDIMKVGHGGGHGVDEGRGHVHEGRLSRASHILSTIYRYMLLLCTMKPL